jgi:hypothetical protein
MSKPLSDVSPCRAQSVPSLADERAVVVDAEKKESERKRKRKPLLGEKKEVCSKRV